MPPERSGIADYSALLVPALRRRVDLEIAPRGKSANGEVALYHMGNDPTVHGWILEQLRRRPGVVVLHDFVLHHLVAGLTLGRKDRRGYLAAMERDAGVAGRLLALGVVDGCIPPLWDARPRGLSPLRRGARAGDGSRRPFPVRRAAGAGARVRPTRPAGADACLAGAGGRAVRRRRVAGVRRVRSHELIEAHSAAAPRVRPVPRLARGRTAVARRFGCA